MLVETVSPGAERGGKKGKFVCKHSCLAARQGAHASTRNPHQEWRRHHLHVHAAESLAVEDAAERAQQEPLQPRSSCLAASKKLSVETDHGMHCLRTILPLKGLQVDAGACSAGVGGVSQQISGPDVDWTPVSGLVQKAASQKQELASASIGGAAG